MTKVTLNDVGSLQNETSALSTINANSAVIETAFDNTLSRDGTIPNRMEASLDMNSNPILNLPPPISNYEPLRVIDRATLNSGIPITVSPLPIGGVSGQSISKNSSTNFDASWKYTPYVVADNFSGNDIGAKINAAAAHLGSTGGRITLVGGAYSGITTTITLTQGPTVLDLNGSTLTFTAGTPGIKVTGGGAAFSTIMNGQIFGSDTVASTNDGITVGSPFFVLDKVNNQGFGRDGVAILSDAASASGTDNADCFIIRNCLFRKSIRDSMHVAGGDSNKGVVVGVEYQCYGRYGLYDISSFGNSYISCIFDGASLAGSSTTAAYVSGSSSVLEKIYCERSTDTIELAGPCIKISTDGNGVQPTIIQSGAATFSQQIQRFTGVGYPAFDSLNVMQPPNGAVVYSTGLRINPTTGNFEIRDLPTGLPILTYDPSIPKWTMNGLLTVTGGITNSAGFTTNDALFFIQNNTDPTKQARFALGGITTGTTRVFSLPDASDTVVTLSATQPLANKTLDNTNTATLKQTQFTLQNNSDPTKQAIFGLAGITTGTTRTYSLPDASDTLATIAATQTFTNKTISSVSNTLTGTASGLTAGNVTTNANLTGDTTSIGNATTTTKINGVDQTTAWTSYTPSVSAGSGTITTSSATGAYRLIGKTCFVRIKVTITTNGSGAGRVIAALPFTATANAGFSGYAGASAAMLNGIVDSGLSLTSVSIYTPTATYPGSDGAILNINGVYETV